jgi:hypothetical protein
MAKLTRYQRRRLSLKAIEVFRTHLFKINRNLGNSLKINLKFIKMDDHSWGICDTHDIGIKPKEYTLLINREIESEKDIITTIAHEMVHVWQYATGKFRDYAVPAHRYGNFVYDANMNYWDMPWEIEARKLEKQLYRYWCKHKY